MNHPGQPKPKTTILLVDDEPLYLEIYQRILQNRPLAFDIAHSGAEALEMLAANDKEYAVALLDISLGDMEGYEVARRLRATETGRHTPILFATAHRTDNESIEQGYAIGAVDYLFKPFRQLALETKVDFFVELYHKSKRLEETVAERTGELSQAVAQLKDEVRQREQREVELKQALTEIQRLKAQLEAENIYLREEIDTASHHELLGRSRAISRVVEAAEQVARTDSIVLILGETGSGKELLARAIHESSRRKNRPMVKVNCAALPGNLIESELFGHEKGAFTGAHATAAGRFEIADGSTLFLDEIGELPLELQAKLLRVLQEGTFERVGSNKTIKVNVRVVTATNRDLAKAVREGRFREDLYYRLNVFPITMPPLRERLEDVPILVRAFVQEFSTRMSKEIQSIPRKTMDLLMKYDWPGNVRELRNVVERAMILSAGPALRVEVPQLANLPTSALSTLHDVERQHINAVLEKTGWRIRGRQGASEILALKPTTLEARMKKLGITRSRN